MTVEDRKVLALLASLAQLDVDAVKAYERALRNVDEPDVHRRLAVFRDDHERHVQELGDAIRSLGGSPPEPKPDLKGLLLGGLTALRSATGTGGALSAMRGNEQLTNRRYDAALRTEGLSDEFRDLIRRNWEDEKRHLRYIEQTLAAPAPREREKAHA